MAGANIQLGASLYGMTSDYVTGKLDLEGCVKTLKDIGFDGIEIVAAQMVPEYPFPSDKWLAQFKELLAKYDMKPLCWSAYIDYGMRTDRDMNREEIIQSTVNDLIYAKKAGFNLVRTQHSISPEILESMIPYCEKMDMILAVEMHHPHHPHVPVWEQYLELMNGKGKGRLGVVPDFSIFQVKPHKLLIKRLIQAGFREDKLESVLKLHAEKAPLKETEALGLTKEEAEFTEGLYEKFNPTSIDDLALMIPATPYIHGKFYYLENGEIDECIPFEKILPKIKQLGYNGAIAAEYEGHHFDMKIDLVQQFTYFKSIFNKYLA